MRCKISIFYLLLIPMVDISQCIVDQTPPRGNIGAGTETNEQAFVRPPLGRLVKRNAEKRLINGTPMGGLDAGIEKYEGFNTGLFGPPMGLVKRNAKGGLINVPPPTGKLDSGIKRYEGFKPPRGLVKRNAMESLINAPRPPVGKLDSGIERFEGFQAGLLLPPTGLVKRSAEKSLINRSPSSG